MYDIKMRSLLFVIMLMLGGVTGVSAKNVLMLVSDDAGREMKVYGNTAIKMPNLDRLAKRSVTFTSAFTTVSSCSPSRSAILTGLPPHQNGMYGLHHEIHHFSSFDRVQSLPGILSSHGYRTGIIGKKHVSPDTVYSFEFDHSETTERLIQVSRNITYIRQLTRDFLSSNDSRPFFLYIGFMDPHRCTGKFGDFCEKFGNGEPEMGSIPDWKPFTYEPHEVDVPYFIQDTPAARQDLANQYTSLSRLDQGIGQVIAELQSSGHDRDTAIIYTSDNGIPFPSAKTNFYDPGSVEPLLISSPDHRSLWGTKSPVLASLLDLVPTVLDFLQVPHPKYHIFNHEPVKLTGKSLLPYLNWSSQEEVGIFSTGMDDDISVYGSHETHEINMYYPMRMIRTPHFKLIHNLNHLMPYPIALDIYFSPTFKDILNRTQHGDPLPWFKTLQHYYYRENWELYDLVADPEESNNIAHESKYQSVFSVLQEKLQNWQKKTFDPWRCNPGGVLDKNSKECFPLHNGL